MTVNRARVGDVLKLVRRAVQIDPLEQYELVGAYSFGKGLFRRDAVPGAALGDYRFFALLPGDLVFSNIQAWEGAIALAGEEHRGLVGTHRFLTYVPCDDRIDASWARWFFLSEAGMTLIRRAAPGTAVRNRTLSVDRFEALEIPLPPIDEQREAAALLNAWWGRAVGLVHAISINGSEVLGRKLPVMTEAVLRQEFSNECIVADLVDLVGDTVHPGDDPTPATGFVGLQHIESHTGRRLGLSPLGEEKGRKFRFRPGDVLYGYLRPYLNKIWVADRHGLCSVDQYVLRPRQGVESRLIGHMLRSSGVLKQAIELTHSLQLPRLRSGLLMGVKVPRPSDASAVDLIDRLDRITESSLALTELKRTQLRAATALHPALMNRVFGTARSGR